MESGRGLSRDSKDRTSVGSLMEFFRRLLKKIRPTRGNTMSDFASTEKKIKVSQDGEKNEKMYQQNDEPYHNSDNDEGKGEDSTKQILQDLYRLNATSGTLPVRIEMWDMGGQIIFYTTHQHVLSFMSLYLLLLDLSRDLHNVVKDKTLDPLKRRSMSVKGKSISKTNDIIS